MFPREPDIRRVVTPACGEFAEAPRAHDRSQLAKVASEADVVAAAAPQDADVQEIAALTHEAAKLA